MSLVVDLAHDLNGVTMEWTQLKTIAFLSFQQDQVTSVTACQNHVANLWQGGTLPPSTRFLYGWGSDDGQQRWELAML